MWLHCAPADDIIVVSEIGEQWSPHTEPARQADIPIIPIVLPAGNMLITIGMKSAKENQAVKNSLILLVWIYRDSTIEKG